MLTYTVRATDSSASAGSADKTVSISITGTNDAPLITLGAGNSDAAALTETNAGLTSSGALSVTDLDITNTVSTRVVSVASTGVTNGITNSTLLSMLSVDATPVIGNTATTGTIHWAFNSNTQAFNHLAAGQTLVLTYTVRATDSSASPASADKTVTITITGTNDAPLISLGAGNSDAATLMTTKAGLSKSGTLSVTDLDVSNTVSTRVVSVASTGATNGISNSALLSMLRVDATPVISNTATTGTINWAFNSNTQAFNYLAAGQTLVLTYTVRATDSSASAGSADKTVTITITGAGGRAVPLIALSPSSEPSMLDPSVVGTGASARKKS